MFKAMTVVMALTAGAAQAAVDGPVGESDTPTVSGTPSRAATLLATPRWSSPTAKATQRAAPFGALYATFGTLAGVSLCIGAPVGLAMFVPGIIHSTPTSSAGAILFLVSAGVGAASLVALLAILIADVASRSRDGHGVSRQQRREPVDPVDAPDAPSSSLPTREWSGTGKAVAALPSPTSTSRSLAAISPPLTQAVQFAIAF